MKIIGSDLKMAVAEVSVGHVFEQKNAFYLKMEGCSLDLKTGEKVTLLGMDAVTDLGPIHPIRRFKDLRVGDTFSNIMKISPDTVLDLVTLKEHGGWDPEDTVGAESSLNLDTMKLC